MKTLVLLTILSLSATSFAYTGSTYTSVKPTDCITVDSTDISNGEIDYYDGECPAFAGYRVNISGGDLRYSLNLSYNDYSIPTVKLSNFHDMGSDKIEWVYERIDDHGGKVISYKALIYRLSYDKYNPNTGESSPTSMLVVMRLNKQNSCVIGKIASQPNMNVIARKLAGSSTAQCL